MKIEALKNDVIISGISCFSIRETFECGQCFRFNELSPALSDNVTTTYQGVAFNRLLTISELDKSGCDKHTAIILHNTTLEESDFWVDYLDLNRDYESIQQNYMKHELLYEFAKYAPGIRILKQDAFESLISFIISQNNNIKRIKGIIERLCSLFGDELEPSSATETDGAYAFKPSSHFGFPTPEALAKLTTEDLSPLRCGWRDEYILDAARKVASGEINLAEIKKAELDEARKQLQIIKGVGPKVAECVLIYGLGRLEAFPMDVWMKRAMSTLFPGSKPSDFAPYPGIAQQYIFHYSRLHPELFPGK